MSPVMMLDPNPINPYGTDLCNALVAQAVDTVLVTSHGYLHMARARCKVREVAAMSAPGRYLQKGLQHLQYLQFIRSLGVDRCPLVHAQWFRFRHEWRLFEWLKKRGVRVVWTAHNVLPHERAEAARGFYLEWYRVPDAIIVHTNHAKRRLQAEFFVEGERVHVVRPGPTEPIQSENGRRAAARDHLQLPRDGSIFLMYGHLRDYKGWQELLDAFEAVTASGHTFTLAIAGKASRDTVRSVRERIGRMEERARTGIRLFIGAEQVVAPDTAASLFAAADAVMLPYRAVTFSAVMLQALAAGRPVIAANLPGLAESLDPQRAGWLYQPGSHARLCEAMVTAISRGPNAGFPEAEIQKGLLRLHAWDSAGVQTANVYRGLGAPV